MQYLLSTILILSLFFGLGSTQAASIGYKSIRMVDQVKDQTVKNAVVKKEVVKDEIVKSTQTTIMGYNNSRIMDQLTDAHCNIIWSQVEELKKIPKEKLQIMRFPGGTIARYYDIDQGGYDGRGKTCNGENYIDKFIEVVKALDTEVILVMNVGSWNTFFWNIDKNKELEWLDKNKRMIEKFQKADVKIFAVELGNEEYLHVPNIGYADPNAKYNVIQKLVGLPQRDAKNRAEIDGYYANYARIYKLHSNLVASMGLKRAIPMVPNAVPRRRARNQVIADVPAEYGVFHLYEKENSSTRQQRYDDHIAPIREQGRTPISTEWAVSFGDHGTETLQLAQNGYKEDYEKWFQLYTYTQNIPLIMQHRLNGNPSTWLRTSANPYDWQTR